MFLFPIISFSLFIDPLVSLDIIMHVDFETLKAKEIYNSLSIFNIHFEFMINLNMRLVRPLIQWNVSS